MIELIGAFALRADVDYLVGLLAQSGFVPVAAESPAMALTRLVKEQGAGVNAYAPSVLVAVLGSGIDFIIMKNGELYFNHFISWGTVRGDKKEIAAEHLKSALLSEIERISNFYTSHLGGKIENLILVAEGDEENLKRLVKGGLTQEPTTLALAGFPNVGPAWFPALGAALRGAVPRSLDHAISLLSADTEERVYESRIELFLALWRNVVVTTLLFLLGLLAVFDLFFIRITRSIQTDIQARSPNSRVAEVMRLTEKARAFNALVSGAEGAVKENVKWSRFLERILANAEASGVAVTTLSIQSLSAQATMSGRAGSEAAAIRFKDLLEADPEFENVSLPPQNIALLSEGVSFTVNLSLSAQAAR